MSNDDQKIIWGDDLQNNKQNSQKTDNSKKSELYDNILQDLAKRSAEHKVNSSGSPEVEKNNKKISSLQDEIKDIMEDSGSDKKKIAIKEEIKEPLSSKTIVNDKKTESLKDSVATSAAMFAIEKKKKDQEPSKEILSKDKDFALEEGLIQDQSVKPKIESEQDMKKAIGSIKDSINKDLNKEQSGIKNETKGENILDEQTKKLLEQKEKKKGIEQTYFSDLSQAMGSDKPATMSELIEKAKYDKKEVKIRSPRSKKNIAYIIGAVVLLGGIIGIISLFFSGKEEVKYITEERVKSLVYSDLDTGINVSNVDSEQTKQAIRKVIETELNEGNLHQIYYAGKDQFGNLRRLGVKQTFEKTENIPPELLYQNIENEFMHGVYKTDENRPFIILKALSYDRAFEGMREWEETIIDDLSTYLDLPKEAGDRSLMEDGFSDGLIKNKNVRVARFLPRDVDRRKGIWNIIDPADTKAEEMEDFSGDQEIQDIVENETNGGDGDTMLGDTISYLSDLFKKDFFGLLRFAYAQTTDQVMCSSTEKTCYDFYGAEVTCGGNEESYQITKVYNEENDPVYLFDKDDAGMLVSVENGDLICVDSVEGSSSVGDTLDENKPIVCYEIGVQCVDVYGNPISENSPEEKSCHDVIYNEKFDTVYGAEKYGEDNYACINTMEGSSFAGDVVAGQDIVCYRSHKECVDSFGNVAYYSPGDTTIICNDIIFNGPGDTIFPPEFYGEPGYSCFSGSSSTPLEYNDALVNTRGPWDWLLDIFFQDDLLANGGQIQPGQILSAVEIIQNELVLLGLMGEDSISGEFDLLTQEVISHFQLINGLPQTGIIDEKTITLLKGIMLGQGEIFGGSQAAIINDYIEIGGHIGLGTYSEDVQTTQILLFVGGYNISHIDGVFDEEVCRAIQAYQEENGLEVSSDEDCMMNGMTIELLNGLILENDYLGSGFILNGNGYLVGSGVLQGMNGPGMIGFEISHAEAESLNEGDIVLMYTFLDEKTILITRHEEVITEVIKRRAFHDIFNK